VYPLYGGVSGFDKASTGKYISTLKSFGGALLIRQTDYRHYQRESEDQSNRLKRHAALPYGEVSLQLSLRKK
jgi:hypothetical protein